MVKIAYYTHFVAGAISIYCICATHARGFRSNQQFPTGQTRRFNQPPNPVRGQSQGHPAGQGHQEGRRFDPEDRGYNWRRADRHSGGHNYRSPISNNPQARSLASPGPPQDPVSQRRYGGGVYKPPHLTPDTPDQSGYEKNAGPALYYGHQASEPDNGKKEGTIYYGQAIDRLSAGQARSGYEEDEGGQDYGNGQGNNNGYGQGNGRQGYGNGGGGQGYGNNRQGGQGYGNNGQGYGNGRQGNGNGGGQGYGNNNDRQGNGNGNGQRGQGGNGRNRGQGQGQGYRQRGQGQGQQDFRAPYENNDEPEGPQGPQGPGGGQGGGGFNRQQRPKNNVGPFSPDEGKKIADEGTYDPDIESGSFPSDIPAPPGFEGFDHHPKFELLNFDDYDEGPPNKGNNEDGPNNEQEQEQGPPDFEQGPRPGNFGQGQRQQSHRQGNVGPGPNGSGRRPFNRQLSGYGNQNNDQGSAPGPPEAQGPTNEEDTEDEEEDDEEFDFDDGDRTDAPPPPPPTPAHPGYDIPPPDIQPPELLVPVDPGGKFEVNSFAPPVGFKQEEFEPKYKPKPESGGQGPRRKRHRQNINQGFQGKQEEIKLEVNEIEPVEHEEKVVEERPQFAEQPEFITTRKKTLPAVPKSLTGYLPDEQKQITMTEAPNKAQKWMDTGFIHNQHGTFTNQVLTEFVPLNNWDSYRQELTSMVDSNVDAAKPLKQTNDDDVERRHDDFPDFRDYNYDAGYSEKPDDSYLYNNRIEQTSSSYPDSESEEINKMRAKNFRDYFRKDVSLNSPDSDFFF